MTRDSLRRIPLIRWVQRIGQRLIEPSAAIQDPAQRRRAQLLSLLLMLLFPFGLYAGLIDYWDELKHSQQGLYVTLFGLVMMALAYGLSRTRHFTLSAWFTIGLMSLTIFGLAIPSEDSYQTNMLIYLIIPVLIGSILLSFQATAIFIALQTAGVIAYVLWFDVSRESDWSGFVLLVSVMILLGTRYLSQLERTRQMELLKTENRYQAFVENLPVGVFRTTPEANGAFMMANPAFLSLFGFESEEELKKVKPSALYDDPAERDPFVENLLAHGKVSDVELRLKRKDGTLIWGAISARVMRDEDTGIICFDCTIKDITGSKLVEAALEEGEQRYRNLFEYSLNAFALHEVVADEQGKIVDYIFLEVNRAFEEMTGLSAADIIGRRVTDVLPGIDQTIFIQVYGHVALTGEPVRFEQYAPPPLDRFYDISAFSPRRGQFAVLFSEITARIRAEVALRESEAQYRELFEGVDDAITVHDLEGNILDVNEAACRRLGYTRDELLQMKIADIDEPGPYAEGFQERVQKQVAQGQLGGIIGGHIAKDGRRIDIETTTKVISYQGQPAVLAVVRDITERKQMEQQLRTSEARYRAVIEDQTELIVRWKLDGTRTFVNDAYCRYFDQPHEQLVGHNFFLLVAEEDRQRIREKIARLNPTHPAEHDIHRAIKPDGSLVWQEWVDRAVFDEHGQIIELQSVGRDVNERIQMSEQVRQERDRAQQYLDIAGVILVALNEQGEITLINRQGREILGYTEVELIGQPWFKMCLPASESDRIYSYFLQLVSGQLEPFDHYENTLLTKSGEERLITWHNTLLHDPAGHIIGTLSSGEDITERRQAENALREQRALAESLHEIASLINSTLDPERVFDRILMNLGRVVPYDLAVIMMVEGGVARIVRFRSDSDHIVTEDAMQAMRFPLNEVATLRQMVSTGKPCIIRDTHAYPLWVNITETNWVRSYIGAPILLTGEIIGFLNMTSAQPDFFTDEHVERLQAFADQAAVAINNARSYDDLERRVIERTVDLSVRNAVAETLSNTLEIEPMLNGVLHTTVERLGVTGGAIYLLSDDGAVLSLAAHYGISAETLQLVTGIVPGGIDLGVIGNVSRVMSNHARDIPHETGVLAVLSVPIWRQGQVQGVITLVHDQPRPWRAEETRMLDVIGRQIGVALVNAWLYADAVRNEAHLRTILQSVADGMLVFDRDNNLTLMNPAAQALFSFYPAEVGGPERAAALLWQWLQPRDFSADQPVEFSLPVISLLTVDNTELEELCLFNQHWTDQTQRDPAWPCWLISNSLSEQELRRCPVFERIPRRSIQAHSATVRDAEGEVLGTVIALHDVTYFRQLDDLKGRFVSTVSHELRTPLSVVLLQVSTLLKYYERLPDDQRREMVGEIQQQAHALRELIEDILELSRFDARRSLPQKQWFDLLSHCDELLGSLEPSIQEKSLHLDVIRQLESSYIRADPQQVMRVLRNLIGNAIKYTPEGGQISLRLEQENGEMRLTVSDTGIGIAPEDQLYIFDRFYRSEQASRMASGHGLGLSIIKEIVDLHGGRIELLSTPGQGSTFTVYLPVHSDD